LYEKNISYVLVFEKPWERRIDFLRLNPAGSVPVFEDEDGFFDPSEFDHYYGEVDYRMQYCNIKGQPFNWLYVDFYTLQHYAEKAGYEATLLREGAHYDYLARITRKVQPPFNEK
jgi:hypothetical protein